MASALVASARPRAQGLTIKAPAASMRRGLPSTGELGSDT